MIGVLLHAGALVRHNGSMLGAHLQYRTLVSDLLIFCHNGSDPSAKTLADLPSVPKPSDAQNGCPICSGQVPACALTGPEIAVLPSPEFIASGWTAPLQYRVLLQGSALWPPARGPPALTPSA